MTTLQLGAFAEGRIQGISEGRIQGIMEVYEFVKAVADWHFEHPQPGKNKERGLHVELVAVDISEKFLSDLNQNNNL